MGMMLADLRPSQAYWEAMARAGLLLTYCGLCNWIGWVEAHPTYAFPCPSCDHLIAHKDGPWKTKGAYDETV